MISNCQNEADFLDFNYVPFLSNTLWESISEKLIHYHLQSQVNIHKKTGYLKKMGISSRDIGSLDDFYKVRKNIRSLTNIDDDSSEFKFLTFITKQHLTKIIHEASKKGKGGSWNARDIEKYGCFQCGNREVAYSSLHAICNQCGTLFDDGNTDCSGEISYSMWEHTTTVGKKNSTYMYKRTNHFRCWINRVQGGESCVIKGSVVEAVKRELKKERIIDEDDVQMVTVDKVKAILKKLKLHKFYNHVYRITAIVTGRKPPKFSAVQEETLLSMFQQIQEPFLKFCPKNRTNMLSYSYIIHKLCEILGWYEFVPYFPLLKSREKIFVQDSIWKDICKEINFPFIKSIA